MHELYVYDKFSPLCTSVSSFLSYPSSRSGRGRDKRSPAQRVSLPAIRGMEPTTLLCMVHPPAKITQLAVDLLRWIGVYSYSTVKVASAQMDMDGQGSRGESNLEN